MVRVQVILAILALGVWPVAAQYLSPEDSITFTPESASSAPVAAPVVAPAPAITLPPSSDGYFIDMAAYGREKNIILTWHLTSGRTNDKRIQIYRFSEEPRVLNDISKGTLVAKLTGEINLYEDVPPSRGAYYYAIFIETHRGLEPGSFTPARNLVGPVNFLSPVSTPAAMTYAAPPPQQFRSQPFDSEEFDEEEPVRYRRPDGDAGSRGINGVIRGTYLKSNYHEAIRRLKPFMRNSSPRVRAKAMFYTGLSRYRLGDSDRALKYLEHPLTQKYYRRNAEFWINRMAENSR